MKYLSKIFIVTLLITAVSCKNDFEEINAPWDKPNSASTPEMFNAVISSLPLTAGEQSVMNAWLYPITQQAAITSGSYPYDNAKNDVWQNYYYTLGNVRVIEDRIAKSADPASMNNVSAMLKTIMAYKSFKLTNYYGAVPYKEAGYAALAADKGVGVYKTKYNTQQEIYTDILTNLKWAVDNLKTDASQYSLGNYETLFKGDISKWIRFANSLRLYIAATIYNKDQALATAHITDALTKPLLGDTENVGIWPADLNLSLQWREWSFSANCYLRMGSTMWSLMSANDNKDGSGIFDPRARIFYEPNNAGEWAAYPQNPVSGVTATEGGTPYDKKRYTAWSDKGASNLYSPVNLYFEQDLTTIPELILTAAQVRFIKAEIYNRGMGVAANAATAKAEYEAGIKASVNMWKGIAFKSPVWTVAKPSSATATDAEISTLLSSPVVAYAADQATALKQIYAQLWIDQFRQPFDAWTLKRRTGDKTPVSASNTQYYTGNFGTYQRFVYPDDEITYNADNFKAAAGGTNLNSTKLWITQ
ncbi:SusD/RagB family nutrient-binding outer membrane lipoprotein [Emticicia sp. 21SJ11W-3]|uniref:SusD/RagB family nutrient-binding outer membrane lipoprotein n=1 Tax=Emticicia sp. 21SJ11W-3 TaxID=2916755 RepID=UPI0020A0DBA7|nr:SusD/RagB family nutrient-binding outer membrane lipoprotein [Emticicia sp. 21SJ11W-3]UTA67661.1 SusD/RagB family nutrient-binding outer membrane lipoprotein [Emticicia sp. 21SJ11W-3]